MKIGSIRYEAYWTLPLTQSAHKGHVTKAWVIKQNLACNTSLMDGSLANS